ncbi:hypothetical protein YTPLAS72_30080 [Nitrospira sp.]|nr:hypothetical protein YTPLAS72_30080 [Nitrospira sp.]
MKPVLKSPVPAEEGVEDSAAVVNIESTLCEIKGCRNFRQPFFIGPQRRQGQQLEFRKNCYGIGTST